MDDKQLAALQELSRRGKLDARRQGALDEIVRRQGAEATQAQAPPPQEGMLAHAFHRLTGTGGQERYQTFPERIIRGPLEAGGEMTQKAMTGQYGPTGEGVTQEDPGKILEAASLGMPASPGAAGALRAGATAAERSIAIKAATPSKAAIKESSQAGYKALQESGLQFSDQGVQTLGADVRNQLEANLASEVAAPTSYKAIEQLEKSGGNLAKIVNIYSKLGSEVTPSAGTDYKAAQTVRKAISDFFEKANPATDVVAGDPASAKALWDHARESWRSYAQMDQIEGLMRAGELRASSSGTAANKQNAIRQEIRKVIGSDARSRGYSDEAKQAMEDIVVGTWTTNTARYVGKYAPSGPVSAMTTFGSGLAALATGGPTAAAAVAAAVAIPTTVAKYLGVYLTRKQVADLERIIAQESPIGRSATKAAREAPPSKDVEALSSATPALVPGAASSAAGALSQRPYDPNLDL